MKIDVLDNISEELFTSEYIEKNKPVVIKNLKFEKDKWHPDHLKDLIGHLPTQEYDSLFDLKNLSTSAFFKIVVTSCLLIKQPLFLDLGERHQLVCSS